MGGCFAEFYNDEPMNIFYRNDFHLMMSELIISPFSIREYIQKSQHIIKSSITFIILFSGGSSRKMKI